MDIERQNFMKEVEAEIKKNNASVKTNEVNAEKIDEIFCEAVKKYGTTLKKLSEN
jgi:hypothetical protein